MNVRQQLVTGSKNVGTGTNSRRYITVHETANTSRGANAAAHANLQSKGNVRVASWHWQVDDAEAVQSFPHSTVCWHAGDGSGPGNRASIGIEVCVNADGDYLAAVKNAARLVAQIMRDEGIALENVVQHNHWSGKDCPDLMRAGTRGVGWKGFLDLVRSAAGQSAPKPTPKPTTPAPAPTPTPAKPGARSQEDDMLPLVQLLYSTYLNRPGSPLEWLDWTDLAARNGWSAADLRAHFMSSRAEPGTVVGAFRYWLRREPSFSEIAEWTDTETIAQVWAGVANSPEAKRLRGAA